MKQTAVEWLYRWINDNQEASIEEAIEAFEKAKEIEKQQIIDAFIDGDVSKFNETPKHYYNKIFNKD